MVKISNRCKWSSDTPATLVTSARIQIPDSIFRTFLGQFFLFSIDVFTKQLGRQKSFFSKVLTKMQVAKEKVVLRDWRDQTLYKRQYLFILKEMEQKHCKEIVLWKLLLQWLITIYESVSTIIDSDLWIFFFNDLLVFTNHFLQRLIIIHESFSSMIDMIYDSFFQWLIFIYKSFYSTIDYDLYSFSSMIYYNVWAIFFNEWLWFTNHPL